MMLKTLDSFKKDFSITNEAMQNIANCFKETMEDSLKTSSGQFKMLPSFLGNPSGKESGVYFTIDMGGTNVRCAKFKIENGTFKKLGEVKGRLKDPAGNFDYVSEKNNAEDLFDYFAEIMQELANENEDGYLGNTFSFPSKQTSINDATLIGWTKEIKVTGVEGSNINKLLTDAFSRKGINIKPVTILNDTVGTLLVGKYTYPDADVGVIMGTGYNSCYLQKNHPLTGEDMIVNMESGNFSKGLPITKYDKELDSKSNNPGSQIMEKMVSGHYMGEIVSCVISDLYNNAELFVNNQSSAELFMSLKFDSLDVENFMLYPQKTVNRFSCSLADAIVIKEVSECVVIRTSRLVAATIIGTLNYIDDGEISKPHTIAIDGTIFEKMPRVPELMSEALKDVLKDKSQLISLKLVKDGSGLGAAIAAAIAVNR